MWVLTFFLLWYFKAPWWVVLLAIIEALGSTGSND